MTNLEKALFERLKEDEEEAKAHRNYIAEQFNNVVNLTDALSALEDFLHLEEIDGERFIIMDAISDKQMPDKFAKAYDYFKYIIDPKKVAEEVGSE